MATHRLGFASPMAWPFSQVLIGHVIIIIYFVDMWSCTILTDVLSFSRPVVNARQLCLLAANSEVLILRCRDQALVAGMYSRLDFRGTCGECAMRMYT